MVSKQHHKYVTIKRAALAGAVMLLGAINAYAASNEAPIVTDSRIKTFVYNENEVFRLVMHYGFQSHIVLDKNEVIQTVSVGDSYAWKITPVENRIFIKPLEESSYTNMTVVTDKRTYQFDLVSKDPKENLEDGLVYMVRFYYPSGTFDMPHLAQGGVPMSGTSSTGNMMDGMMMAPGMSPMPSSMMPGMGMSSGMPPMPAPEPYSPPAAGGGVTGTLSPVMGGGYTDYKSGGAPVSANTPIGSYNFNYTLSGPDSIAPDRVFDDGQKTYFEFPSGMNVPAIALVQGEKNETPMDYTKQDGFVVVKGVGKKFSLRSQSNTVYVYNENI